MKSVRKKLILSIALLVFINAFGVVGYMIIEGWNFMDSLFMTVITITTVGYREVHDLTVAGEIFTIVLLVLGVGIILYLLGSEAKLLLEGQLEDIIGRKRLEKKIRDLKDHYIICGFGRMGKTVAKELSSRDVDILIIEKEVVPDIQKGEFLIIEGDANNEDVLMSAGIENAKGIISVLPTDAENLFLVLSARDLNPDLFIVTRANEESSERKILNAGADRVVSPYITGGIRMANSVLKPAVVDFIEYATNSGNLEIELEEISLANGSKVNNMTLQSAGIERDLGVIIVAIKRKNGTMEFNPNFESIINSGDTLVALGESPNLKELGKLVGVS
ncbi:MAG: potassium transporter TrkA [Thermodesulfobacteriota bacterium]|nr:MAG: potassium transporter TrkA [Thermodesulfobacteriota bacterium]